MKDLKEILLEKLSVDSITFNEFPINRPIKEWVNFLENHDFMRIDDNNNIIDIDEIIDLLNDAHGKVFFLGEDNEYIYLADTTKSNIDKRENHYYFHRDTDNIFCKDVDTVSKEKFMKAICDEFGFEFF